MSTAVGGLEPHDDNDDYKDAHSKHKRRKHHKTNIYHEHISGSHESELMGHQDDCPNCHEDWNKRRSY